MRLDANLTISDAESGEGSVDTAVGSEVEGRWEGGRFGVAQLEKVKVTEDSRLGGTSRENERSEDEGDGQADDREKVGGL